MNNQFIIVVASYNNAQWVESNIGSILSQDYPHFKVLYFDDASSDNTAEKVKELVRHDKRFEVYDFYNERKYKTWFFSNIFPENDNSILVFLDGDDMFSSENVLSYLNSIYNQANCWMTYGGMEVWEGEDRISQPHPQNSQIPDEVIKNRSYRKDLWRTSHLKTMKSFVWKKINKTDFIHDGKYIVGPDDLSIMFSALELCPPNKVYRITEPVYYYNHSPENGRSRAFADNKELHIDYESIIRNRNPYPPIQIVSPTLAGGLGNQMFEVAAAASLAKDNNAIVIINREEHILPNQGRNVKNYLDNIFSKFVTDTDPQTTVTYSWEHASYKPIPYQPNIKLRGHFQSYKYFDHNREYIQHLFNSMVGYFLPKSKDFTAVQVRRGDYYKFPNHHPLLTSEYYTKAVKITNSKNVVVYSDDIPWCKTNLNFGIPVTYANKNTDWEEMLEMATYQNLIISNSSFGWWAAYLNKCPDKKIYVPSTWFGPALIADGFKADDMIMPEWIKIL